MCWLNIACSKFSGVRVLVSTACVCVLLSVTAQANTLRKAIDTSITTQRAETRSQQRIDQLDDETKQLLQQYRDTIRQTQNLKIYNQTLEQQLLQQREKEQTVRRQIAQTNLDETELLPLMQKMLEALEKFVTLDLPFQLEIRRNQLIIIKKMLADANIPVAQKYRQVLDAYQTENDYGRNLEAYRGRLNTGDKERVVDYLRIGRVALYYRTLDGVEIGHWDRQQKSWQRLPDEYRSTIKQGLRIARKQAAPELLELPIFGPRPANEVAAQ